jgi:hypothetical protein
VIKDCNKIAKESKLLPEEFKAKVKDFYQSFKCSESCIIEYLMNKVKSFSDYETTEKFIVRKIKIL